MQTLENKLTFSPELDEIMKNADFADGLTVDEVPALKARQARKKAQAQNEISKTQNKPLADDVMV